MFCVRNLLLRRNSFRKTARWRKTLMSRPSCGPPERKPRNRDHEPQAVHFPDSCGADTETAETVLMDRRVTDIKINPPKQTDPWPVKARLVPGRGFSPAAGSTTFLNRSPVSRTKIQGSLPDCLPRVFPLPRQWFRLGPLEDHTAETIGSSPDPQALKLPKQSLATRFEGFRVAEAAFPPLSPWGSILPKRYFSPSDPSASMLPKQHFRLGSPRFP